MNAFYKTTLVAVTLGLGLGIASSLHAEPRLQPYLLPNPGPGNTPRLGFHGHFEWGHGMVVEHVRRGTPAARLGLEAGDVIRAVNGRWLRSQGDYFRELRHSDGYVRLVIEDVRTGRLVSRTAYIGGGIAAYGANPASGPASFRGSEDGGEF